MLIRKAVARAAAVLVILAAALPVGVAAARGFHFELMRSVPAADATVQSPGEVRLWFSEVPQSGSVGVRLLDASQQLVATDSLREDAQDGKVFSVALKAPLAPAGYTVSWRGIGDDGHVVRGTFAFSVAAER